MARKPQRKRGLPLALEEQAEILEQESPREFVEAFFPDGAAQQQSDLPSVDWLKQQFQTKSAAIRYLYNLDPQTSQVAKIAKHLGIKYQHARNVIKTVPKRGANEDWTKPYHAKPNTETPDDAEGK